MTQSVPQLSDRLDARRDRVVLSVNPRAGAGSSADQVRSLVAHLCDAGLESECFDNLDGAAGSANRWHDQGRLRALVGVGGDGTARELVNRTRPGVPLTMLSGGTANLLARHLGMGPSPALLARQIVEGRICRLDAGQAGDRVFLLMASCGFDAEVVRRLHARRQGHMMQVSYALHFATTLARYRYPEIRVRYWVGDEAGGEAAETTVRWVFAFNLPCYAGFNIAPFADGADGLLDLCTLANGSAGRSLWYAAMIQLQQHLRLSDFATRRVRRISVTADEPVPCQLDGDPAGGLPLEINVLPKRMTCIVPADKSRGKDSADA